MELQDPNKYKLTEAESRRIFQEHIAPLMFRNIKSSNSPKAVFVGAQPGAGKTVLQSRLKRELDAEQPSSTVSIIGDDLRAFHPLYSELLGINDTAAAFYTDRDSGAWVEQFVAYASDVRCSAVIEGTLRTAETPINTARALKEKGFEIEFNVLIVPSILSRLGILQRYLEQVRDTGTGRFTVVRAHDDAYSAIPTTLEQLAVSETVDSMHFYRRGGVRINTFRPSKSLAGEISGLYVQLRDEPLNTDAIKQFHIEIQRLISLAREFHKSDIVPILTALDDEIR